MINCTDPCSLAVVRAAMDSWDDWFFLAFLGLMASAAIVMLVASLRMRRRQRAIARHAEARHRSRGHSRILLFTLGPDPSSTRRSGGRHRR